MIPFRLGVGIAGLLAVLAAAWLIADRFHQLDRARSADRCEVAARTTEKALTDCLPGVAERIVAARRADACEAALLPRLRDETRFAMAQSCGAGVKRLVAFGDQTAADADQLRRDLANQAATSGRAIARAEQRAIHTTEREYHASQAIAVAPRDAAGRIRCDAQCLRQLAQ